MINPKKEMRDYLNNLIQQQFFINGLNKQLKIFQDWKTDDRVESLNIGAYFFRLVTYSFNRTIIIELCKLLSDKEGKSITDFLIKSKGHYNSIEPTTFNTTLQQREKIKKVEYLKTIEEQENIIFSKKDIINNIKAHRDKVLVHSDASYFKDRNKLYEDYPFYVNQVDELLTITGDILNSHHIMLLESDLEMEISSLSNVDSILTYVRAYHRIINDPAMEKHDPLKYKWDDYNKSK